MRGQRPNTRARRHLDVNESKIIAIADKYRAARVAKMALAGPGRWEKTWCELAKSDVRTMLAEDDPRNKKAMDDAAARAGGGAPPMLSEGRRQTSWIWMAAGGDGTATGMQDGTSQCSVVLVYVH